MDDHRSKADRVKGSKIAKAGASAEQARRIQEAEIQKEIDEKTRYQSQQEADRATGLEQQRRISEQKSSAKSERKRRKQSVDLVIAAAEEERLRRIAELGTDTGTSDRKANIAAVTAATEEERLLRIEDAERRKEERNRRKSVEYVINAAEKERLRRIKALEVVTMQFEPRRFGILLRETIIEDVDHSSQAAELGVRIGFKILSINGVEQLYSADSILKAISKTYCAGQNTTIVFRKAHLHQVTFTPGQFGIQFQGNRVEKVCSGTQADVKNVGVGFIIAKVNGVEQPNNTFSILEAIEESNHANQETTITFCEP